jgi:DNA excision repair protein ERCC-2
LSEPGARDADADASFSVAVRALCEFAARAGDLDLRFTPSPTAQQGIEGHRAVAGRRNPGWQAEFALETRHGDLRVRGRADGWDEGRGLVEEIKTHRGDAARIPANHRALHRAQARVYGWLLCERFGLPRITVSVVYVAIEDLRETRFDEDCEAQDLRRGFEALCERWLAWARQEAAHRAARDAALTVLPFPLPAWREGQRELAEAVFRTARAGACLMAQAPTGIGKTLGTLFPLLRACPGAGLDRIFFLSAKGTGTALAMEALGGVRAASPTLPLRVLALTAKDKACEHPDKACHGESCPLARGFHDRLPAARAAAAGVGAGCGEQTADDPPAATAALLDAPTLRKLALAHDVCPYWLGHEMARWADVVVGDCNHFFDQNALLHALALDQGWKVALLIDEAHNLPERARAMWSAELTSRALREATTVAPAGIRRPLQRLRRAWNALAREPGPVWRPIDALPAACARALVALTEACAEQLAQDPAGLPPALLQLHFDALAFGRLLETHDPAHSVIDLRLLADDGTERAPASARAGNARGGAPDSALGLRNLVPAPFLGPRFAVARATVLFSATLSPPECHADLLGLPADARWLEVSGPFRAEQLRVKIVSAVSTRLSDRAASLGPIADLIAEQLGRAPGNYLAFFSSHDYLAQAADTLAERHPQLPQWRQPRGADPAAREAFLERFQAGGQGVGFAVLGGAFAEGVDLPGERLIGAFVATLGLPPAEPLNELTRARLDAAFGRGHDYTYLYPGIRKVVQAAGRVIRTPHDRGWVFLIDDRFRRAEVRRLLPAWWDVEG